MKPPAVPTEMPQALESERKAFNVLVVRHQRAVMVALLARGIRADLAQDHSQAAWTRLWEQHCLGRLPRLELPGLAIRQALFLALDEARALRALGGIDSLVDAGPDPDRRLLSRQQLRSIEVALRHVHPSMREVFLLAHGGEGLSHAEIALRVGLSVQRVRQILCELRQRFRGLVEDR